MLIGIPPFYHNDQKEMFKLIKYWKVAYPESIKLSDEVKDLINRLLEKDPKKRLGSGKNGFGEIICHDWFKMYDINALKN